MKWKARVQAAVAATFFLAGPVSLAIFPLPALVVLALWTIGLVAGLLSAPRDQVVALVGLGVAYIGTDAASEHFEKTIPGLVFPVWQPILLTFSGLVAAYFGSRFLWRLFSEARD